MKKILILEISKPQKKSHKKLFGETSFDAEHINTIWIDERQQGKQLVDTFFHEMTHVFLGIAGKQVKLSVKEEEALCRMVGQMASSVLTKGATK